MLDIPFRCDEYGKSFYLEDENGFRAFEYKNGTYTVDGISFRVSEEVKEEVLEVNISISADRPIPLRKLGMRLGIDTYMERFPDWNEKCFPTALRCEKEGFWSCFMSPLGKIVAVCSPSKIVSWKNEYCPASYDIAGHRIYTSSIEFINTYPQPDRHPNGPSELSAEPITAAIYYSVCESEEAALRFIKKY